MNDYQNKEKTYNKNKYLTEKERYQMEILLKDGKSKKDIATLLGKSVRTIQREFKRGLVEMLSSNLVKKLVYCADTSQMKYEEKKKNKGASFKIGNDHALVRHIEEKISKQKYSPDAVIGEIKSGKYTFKTSICTKTLYNYINSNFFLHISNKDLPVKKDGKKRDYHKIKRLSLKNQRGRSISERPKEIDCRDIVGHWEMDCVVGKRDSKSVLLVLTERCSRKALIYKMLNKTQESVKSVLDILEKEYGSKFKEYFKSITMDNGVEFINQPLIENSCIEDDVRTTAYYAHAYSSWERGSNEHTNKMIRRFIPKGTDIEPYTIEEIKEVERWLNEYPRKLLNYKSAEMVYNEKLSEVCKD